MTMEKLKSTKREIGDVWKDGACWKVQGPRAQTAFFKKGTALAVSDSLKKEVAREAYLISVGIIQPRISIDELFPPRQRIENVTK